jgi:hypothetical protein
VTSARRLTSKRVLFIEEDAAEFSAALRGEFPSIRFLPKDESRWIDVEAGMDAPLPYLPSLAAPNVSVFQAWLEPPEWKPVLLPVSTWEGDALSIFNKPHFSFIFIRSEVPRAKGENEIEHMNEGSVYAYCGMSDREHKRFVAKVFRIVDKMTVRVFDVDSPKTGLREKNVRTPVHAGMWALRWASQRDNRRLSHDLRPVGSVRDPRPARSYEEIYGPELAAKMRHYDREEEARRLRRAAREQARKAARDG